MQDHPRERKRGLALSYLMRKRGVTPSCLRCSVNSRARAGAPPCPAPSLIPAFQAQHLGHPIFQSAWGSGVMEREFSETVRLVTVITSQDGLSCVLSKIIG